MGAGQSSPQNEQRNSRCSSVGQSSSAVPPRPAPPRPAPPHLNVETGTEANINSQNNLNEAVKTTQSPKSSRSLYPNLNNNENSSLPGKSPANNNCQPVRNSSNNFHCVNSNFKPESLDRQRNSQNNLNEAVKTTQSPNSSRSLYPNLNNNENSSLPGKSLANNNCQPVRNSSNNFHCVNSNFKPERFTPSAPPAPSSPPSRQRQRSVSRPRSNAETEISCPTCKNPFGVKIFNCLSGHASCMNCRMQQRPCGLCGNRITKMRNISVEEYVLELKVPCVNKGEGCLLHLKLSEMEQHGKECPFKETKCWLPLCYWKDNLSLLNTHFETFHPVYKKEVDTEMFLELPNTCEIKKMFLVNIGTFNFVLHMIASSSKNRIYVAVQLLGTKHSADKWTYEIHIYDKGAPRRKYQFIDKCFSSADSLADIMNENTCAVLPMQYAKTFVNHGSIAYKFYIKRDFNKEYNRDVSACSRGGRGRGGFRKF